jgi:N-acetylneuraminic acid mutarotase
MIIWGGQNHGAATSTGGRYNPSTGSWVSMTLTGAPNARHFHSAVWTGTQMLVWGGTEPSVGTTYFNGGAYNPAANTWSAMSSLGAPQARSHHAAVWTGTSMLVWGGTNGTAGGVYSPAENTWKAMLMTDAPTRRNGFAAVWTGNEMVVWGGLTETGITATGGRYTPP